MNTGIITTVNNLVSLENGEPTTTSLIIAEAFEKQHKNVIRDIEELIAKLNSRLKNEHTPYFEKSEYHNDRNGQVYTMYILDRDAFSLLVMGFNNTPTVLEWKLKFIAAFNAMERQLRSGYIESDRRAEIAKLILKTSSRSQVQAIKELYPDYFSQSALPGSLEYTVDVNTSYRNWIDDFGITLEWITDFPTKDIYLNYARYCTDNRYPIMGKKIFSRTVENDFNLSRRQKSDGLRYFMTL